MTYLNDFIQKIEKAVGDKSKAYSSTFQINSLVSSTDEEGVMETQDETKNFIKFSAYNLIPLIEKSKYIIYDLFLILLLILP